MGGGDQPGGSAELARQLDKRGECILADLREYYGVDLSDVVKPGSGVTPSVVLTLLRQLPVGSRTIADMRGGEQFRDWNNTQYQLATVIDAVQQNTHALVTANSKKAPKAPDPAYRPGNKPKTTQSGQSFAGQVGKLMQQKRDSREVSSD